MTRRLIRITAIVVPLALLMLFGLSKLGTFLVVEDPLDKADAIFVLGGTRFERPLEAVDLFNEGWAPQILLFRVVKDFGEVELLKRGFAFPLESDVQSDALRRMGVPADKVIVLGEKDSTKDEALEIRDQVVAHNWKKIIVEAERYRLPFGVLNAIDRTALALCPPLGRYCRMTVIVLER